MSDCQHPPEKHLTGVFNPDSFETEISGKKLRDYVSDTLWVACYACGEVIRPAPLALRLEAIHKAVKRTEDYMRSGDKLLGLYVRRFVVVNS